MKAKVTANFVTKGFFIFPLFCLNRLSTVVLKQSSFEST
jgi:hypothetical protein